MQKSSDGSNNFDEASQQRGKPVIGDADNVQKTSYVVGHGTDPSTPDPERGHGEPFARRGETEHGYTATVKAGGGPNIGLWVVVILALAIALVYGFGIFT